MTEGSRVESTPQQQRTTERHEKTREDPHWKTEQVQVQLLVLVLVPELLFV